MSSKTEDLLGDAASLMGAAAWMYSHQPKAPPTIEDLKSELEATKNSHLHANRALTNMSVALSDAMDRCVAYEEEARKTKLAHQKEIAHLKATGDAERRLLNAERSRADALEKTLTEERARRPPEATGVGG